MLEAILQQEPNNERAWIWMTDVTESDSERRVCLEKVLSINPSNLLAKEGLNRLGVADPFPANSTSTLPRDPKTVVPDLTVTPSGKLLNTRAPVRERQPGFPGIAIMGIFILAFVLGGCGILLLLPSLGSQIDRQYRNVVSTVTADTKTGGVTGGGSFAVPPATLPDSAPASALPQPSSTREVKLGERQVVDGVGMTILSVRADPRFSTSDNKGNVFLVMDVLIENLSRKEPACYNYMLFKAKDSDGFEYDNSVNAVPLPRIFEGNLQLGEKVRGNIAFNVKGPPKSLMVTYELGATCSPGFVQEPVQFELIQVLVKP